MEPGTGGVGADMVEGAEAPGGAADGGGAGAMDPVGGAGDDARSAGATSLLAIDAGICALAAFSVRARLASDSGTAPTGQGAVGGAGDTSPWGCDGGSVAGAMTVRDGASGVADRRSASSAVSAV